MGLGALLIIVAGILAILDLAFGRGWGPDRPHRARWLTPVAVLLVCIALLLGAEPIINT